MITASTSSAVNPATLSSAPNVAVGDKVHVGVDQSGQHGAVPDLHDVDVLGQIREAVLDADDPVAVDETVASPGTKCSPSNSRDVLIANIGPEYSGPTARST